MRLIRVEDADLIVLNTCHIRERASEKIFSELGKLRELKEEREREGRRTMLVVAGCVAQAEGGEILRRQPAVDVVVGPQSYHRLPQLLREARVRPGVVDTEFPADDKFSQLPAAAGRRDSSAWRLRLRDRAGGLRQVLLVLRRALYPRRRGLSPRACRSRRDRAPCRRGRARGHPARPERQRLSWARRSWPTRSGSPP